MSYLVRLHIFSGREDPIFEIDDGEAEAVISEAVEAGAAKTPALRGLGYRGFSVLSAAPDKRADELAAMNDQSDSHSGAFIAGAPELEMRLLELALKRVDLIDLVIDEVRAGIKRPVPASLEGAAKGCPPCYGASAPAYNPGWWNNNPTILRNNNCYNYANNQATNTFAQPGRATGRPITALTCGGVQPSAVSDGLVAAPGFANRTSGWYVALVIWPGVDYHWYRQDNNGCWSHKPGSTPVINVDNSGKPITDPRTCDRGSYTNFCSYMITNTGVRIR